MSCLRARYNGAAIFIIQTQHGFQAGRTYPNYGLTWEKKRKKHPQKPTKAKGDDASKGENLYNAGLMAAISHALSSGWVQNSTVTFLGAIVILAGAMATNTQVKAAAIAFGLMGTAAVWIFTMIVIRHSTESKAPE